MWRAWMVVLVVATAQPAVAGEHCTDRDRVELELAVVALEQVDETSWRVQFRAPAGTDRVDGYEIRYLVNDWVTDDNFEAATLADFDVVADGELRTFVVSGLTMAAGDWYSIGIRAFDDCGRAGPIAVVSNDTLGCVCGCGSAGEAGMLVVVVAGALCIRRRRR